MGDVFTVGILLGGPSAERAISLNSARSVADHLEGDGLAIDPIIYFDITKRPYRIDRRMLYSNTPSDFDFKLSSSPEARSLSTRELEEHLRRGDFAFPVMHGVFGEDGGVQTLLEGIGVPYVGSGPDACRVAYDKYRAHRALRTAGVPTVPSVLHRVGGAVESVGGDDERVAAAAKVVIKPTAGGSSLGVTVVGGTARERLAAVEQSLERHGDVVVQPYVDGTEFTTVVLEGPDGPVALLPIEIELRSASANGIFSFRHKYMPSDASRYHCPPRHGDDVVEQLRSVAEQAFRVLGLRDFARIDCWLTDGRIVVSDVNPISGMEQNSFLFIEAAEIGMSHADVLRHIVASACRRHGITVPAAEWKASDRRDGRARVPILFGGTTAERHVSVLSGTNVWMKLMHSPALRARPVRGAGRGDGVRAHVPAGAAPQPPADPRGQRPRRGAAGAAAGVVAADRRPPPARALAADPARRPAAPDGLRRVPGRRPVRLHRPARGLRGGRHPPGAPRRARHPVQRFGSRVRPRSAWTSTPRANACGGTAPRASPASTR